MKEPKLIRIKINEIIKIDEIDQNYETIEIMKNRI
jgi:hypothetical protein